MDAQAQVYALRDCLQEVAKHLNASSLWRARLASKTFREAFSWAVKEVLQLVDVHATVTLGNITKASAAYPAANGLLLALPDSDKVASLQLVLDGLLDSRSNITLVQRLNRLSVRPHCGKHELQKERQTYRDKYVRRPPGAQFLDMLGLPVHLVLRGNLRLLPEAQLLDLTSIGELQGLEVLRLCVPVDLSSLHAVARLRCLRRLELLPPNPIMTKDLAPLKALSGLTHLELWLDDPNTGFHHRRPQGYTPPDPDEAAPLAPGLLPLILMNEQRMRGVEYERVVYPAWCRLTELLSGLPLLSSLALTSGSPFFLNMAQQLLAHHTHIRELQLLCSSTQGSVHVEPLMPLVAPAPAAAAPAAGGAGRSWRLSMRHAEGNRLVEDALVLLPQPLPAGDMLALELFGAGKLEVGVVDQIEELRANTPLASLVLLHAYWTDPLVPLALVGTMGPRTPPAEAAADGAEAVPAGPVLTQLQVFGRDKECYDAAQRMLLPRPTAATAEPTAAASGDGGEAAGAPSSGPAASAATASPLLASLPDCLVLHGLLPDCLGAVLPASLQQLSLAHTVPGGAEGLLLRAAAAAVLAAQGMPTGLGSMAVDALPSGLCVLDLQNITLRGGGPTSRYSAGPVPPPPPTAAAPPGAASSAATSGAAASASAAPPMHPAAATTTTTAFAGGPRAAGFTGAVSSSGTCPGLRSLQSLSLHSCVLRDLAQLAVGPSLRRLELQCNVMSGRPSMQHLAASCPDLRKLILEESFRHAGSGSLSMSYCCGGLLADSQHIRGLTRLEQLSVPVPEGREGALSRLVGHLQALPSLASLTVYCLGDSAPAGMRCLSSLQQLDSLKLQMVVMDARSRVPGMEQEQAAGATPSPAGGGERGAGASAAAAGPAAQQQQQQADAGSGAGPSGSGVEQPTPPQRSRKRAATRAASAEEPAHTPAATAGLQQDVDGEEDDGTRRPAKRQRTGPGEGIDQAQQQQPRRSPRLNPGPAGVAVQPATAAAAAAAGPSTATNVNMHTATGAPVPATASPRRRATRSSAAATAAAAGHSSGAASVPAAAPPGSSAAAQATAAQPAAGAAAAGAAGGTGLRPKDGNTSPLDLACPERVRAQTSALYQQLAAALRNTRVALKLITVLLHTEPSPGGRTVSTAEAAADAAAAGAGGAAAAGAAGGQGGGGEEDGGDGEEGDDAEGAAEALVAALLQNMGPHAINIMMHGAMMAVMALQQDDQPPQQQGQQPLQQQVAAGPGVGPAAQQQHPLALHPPPGLAGLMLGLAGPAGGLQAAAAAGQPPGGGAAGAAAAHAAGLAQQQHQGGGGGDAEGEEDGGSGTGSDSSSSADGESDSEDGHEDGQEDGDEGAEGGGGEGGHIVNLGPVHCALM